MFRVGMKVECIDAKVHTALLGTALMDGLTEGGIYTVRWVGIDHHPAFGEAAAIRLYEIVRPACPRFGGIDVPFMASRFRPVVERKTSIEIFQRMLSPTKDPTHA